MSGHMKKLMATSVVLCLGCTSQAWAGVKSDSVPSATGVQISQLERSAREGYAPAQYRLGLAYAAGTGVAQNLKKAVHWWRLAAKNLDAAAQLELGNAYAHGWGVRQDINRAIHYWKLAAADGHRDTARQAEKLLDSAV